jgi:predicted MFS family arabinose efflux permease
MPLSPTEFSPRTEKLIYAAAFFSLSSEILMGLALPLLALERGLSLDIIGILLAVAAIGPVLFALPAGALCDHFGDKKVLLTMTSGIALTAFLYPFMTTLAGLLVLQLLAGTCRSNAWVAVQSYMVRTVPAESVPKMAGKFSASVNSGLLVAPVIGGFFYTTWGPSAAFALMGFWGMCYAFFTFLLPNSKAPSDTLSTPAWQICVQSYRAALPILLQPMLAIMMFITLARLMSGGIGFSFYPVYLKDIGLAAFTIGILLTFMNGSATLGGLIADWLAKRIGLMGAMLGSLAVAVIAIAILPIFQNVWAVGVISIIHGVTFGISMPLLLAGISHNSKPGQRGLILGLRSVFNRAGIMSSALLLGFLVEGGGMLWGFMITGLIILVILAIITAAIPLIDRSKLAVD